MKIENLYEVEYGLAVGFVRLFGGCQHFQAVRVNDKPATSEGVEDRDEKLKAFLAAIGEK